MNTFINRKTNSIFQNYSLIMIVIMLLSGFVPIESVFADDNSLLSNITHHVEYLADDAREGRGIGTAGLDSAAAYIEYYFKRHGLSPLFDSSYTQPFTIPWGAKIVDGNSLGINDVDLVIGEDYIPSGWSETGFFTGTVIFAGYGVSAPEYEYDDYAKIDVKDKIVVVLEGEPAADNPDSKFEGKMQTQHATMRNKAVVAKTYGAAGLLLLINLEEGDSAELPKLGISEPYKNLGIPIVYVNNNAIKKLFPKFNPMNAKRSIDLNETPRSMPLSQENIDLSVNLKRNSVPVKNVGAKIPGDERVVVVGAHYDHLGYGQEGTTEPETHAPHNGADDNASGVAVLLELSRTIMGEDKNSSSPTYWFISFTAEEVGLGGSSYFVDNPPGNIENIEFMLNLDMIGRMEDNSLTVYGVNSAEELEEIAKQANTETNLNLALTGGGYGPSDQTSFYAEGIPVLHLFTSAHLDYHSSRDDADKLNYPGIVSVYNYAKNILEEISEPGVVLTYHESESAPPEPSSNRANRPSLGTIPDFSQPDSIRGVRLQAVRPGTPAAQAGMQKGDILVKLGSVILDNIYDFVFALDSYKPDDEVEVEYYRGEELIKSTAVLAPPSGRKH